MAGAVARGMFVRLTPRHVRLLEQADYARPVGVARADEPAARWLLSVGLLETDPTSETLFVRRTATGDEALRARKEWCRPTLYQRIVRAAAEGRQIRLSLDEVRALARDQAIITRAELDDAADARGCLDAWHEWLPVTETEPDTCPSCGSDE